MTVRTAILVAALVEGLVLVPVLIYLLVRHAGR